MKKVFRLWLYPLLLTSSFYIQAQNPDISNATVIATGTTTARSEASRWADVINAKDFGAVGNDISDDTVALNAAINAAFTAGRDLFIPSGIYRVSGLWLPGRVIKNGQDDRGKSIRIYGQGHGEPYAIASTTSGTIIRSEIDAPVLQDCIGYDNNGDRVCGNGTVEVDHIRFEGNSKTPVILLNSFYGLSNFHNITIRQQGVGDGIKITYAAGVWVRECHAINYQWITERLYSSRTGIGFNFPSVKDGGLVTFSKCSARGWLTGYVIGGDPKGTPYVTRIENSECSYVYNGIINYGQKSIIDGNYLEGGDQGVGIQDYGDYTTISNNFLFAGFAKGIDASNSANIGTLIQGNVIHLGGLTNSIGVDIGSSSNKNVVFNSIDGCTNNNAIHVNGNNSGLTCIGNLIPR